MARWIGKQTGLPVQHMDHIHWMPNWVERPRADRLEMIRLVEGRDHWVIECGISERLCRAAGARGFVAVVGPTCCCAFVASYAALLAQSMSIAA